jgi:hypothetical protein
MSKNQKIILAYLAGAALAVLQGLLIGELMK